MQQIFKNQNALSYTFQGYMKTQKFEFKPTHKNVNYNLYLDFVLYSLAAADDSLVGSPDSIGSSRSLRSRTRLSSGKEVYSKVK